MIIDVDSWLSERGIHTQWAKQLVEDVRRDYPNLTKALKAWRDVEAELEFVQFAHELRRKTIENCVPLPEKE